MRGLDFGFFQNLYLMFFFPSTKPNSIKIFALHDHNDIEHVLTVDDEPSLDQIDWTADGQLLAVASSSGTIHVYLSQLKILGDKYGTSLAFLSSLLEVTVFNVAEEVVQDSSVMIVRIEIEPSHLAIGPFHLAVAMNNRLWLYSLTAAAEASSLSGSAAATLALGSDLVTSEMHGHQQQQQNHQNHHQHLNLLTGEHEYVGIVKTVKLNAHYIVVQFTNGSLQLHAIENAGPGADQRVYNFPDGAELAASKSGNAAANAANCSVTSIALTGDFLIFALAGGQLHYFILEDWSSTVVYRHAHGISALEANHNGSRLILLDDRGDVLIFNAYGETVVQMASENVPSTANSLHQRGNSSSSSSLRALWESWTADRAVFTLSDGKFIHVYAAVRSTLDNVVSGRVEHVGRMKIPSGQYPLLLYNGVVVCQTVSGKTANFILR